MKLIFLVLIVGLLTFLQAFGFSVLGVKPNLALAAIITASFFIANIWQGFLLVALASFILKFSPGFESGILLLSLIGVGANIVKKYHPWHYFFGNLISIALGTFIFYLFLGTNLITSPIFLKELALNLTAGMIIFAFLTLLCDNKFT
mgnify:CR=1 FL=1